MHEWVALVPMRHQSERVPGKNYRPIAGEPLYAYILDTLLGCQPIERVVVDTDSPVIMEGVAERFPSVHLLERPESLRGGAVPMNEVLKYDVEQVPSTFYLQTHSTNPLLSESTLLRSIESFMQHYPERDSLFSVTRWHTRLWDEEGKPVNHDPEDLLRTQDLPPMFEENSCIYIFEREAFLVRGNRIGLRPILFEIDPDEAIDIDDEHNFELAECLLERRKGDHD